MVEDNLVTLPPVEKIVFQCRLELSTFPSRSVREYLDAPPRYRLTFTYPTNMLYRGE